MLATPALAQTRPRVVVIGGGFAGATAAQGLQARGLAVTLVAGAADYVAPPLSSQVLTGLRPYERQVFTYAGLAALGITFIPTPADAIDPKARTIRLATGTDLAYDRLILAPGIGPVWGAIKGHDEAAATRMPHAWWGGPQLRLLRDQLATLRKGGLVIISVPTTPYRCPPAPYERASLIAHMIQTRNLGAKLLILDAKDAFSQSAQFRQAWAARYPAIIEWIGLSDGGAVTAIDAAAGTVSTDFETYKPDIANIIPQQRAAPIATIAADRTGWCPVNPDTFESTIHPNIHIIGDAVFAGQVGKSAYAAATQAHLVAGVIAAQLNGTPIPPPNLSSICTSLAAPDWGFSIANTYRQQSGSYIEVPLPETTPLNATPTQRAATAASSETWFDHATSAAFP
jgi:NADPH-dependent 2,4-dienoyl-CoA reductase/sulfur reductase-like enzyme